MGAEPLTAEFDAVLHYLQGAKGSAGVDLDWNILWDIARDHGVASLFYAALPDSVAMPANIRRRFADASRQTAMQTAFLTAELSKLQSELQTRGIRTLSYKGPILSALLYGEQALREFSDIDLLIRPEDFTGVRNCLQSAGFTPEYDLGLWTSKYLRSGTVFEFLAPENSYRVELHWKTRSHPSLSPHFDPEWLWSDTQWITMGGVPVETLSLANMFLLTCIHAAKHRWSQLRWLGDLIGIGTRLDSAGWEIVWIRARASDNERIVRLAVALANRLLGTNFPAQSGPDTERLVRLVATTMAAGTAASPLLQLRLRSGLRAQTRLIQYLLLTPNVSDYVRYPLPPGFGFLFPAMRIYRLVRHYGLGFRRAE